MLDLLRKNWPLKVLALGLAFSIWASVTTESRIVQDFTVPLEVRLPDDAILAMSPPTTATVRLGGPERAIRNLDPVGLSVRADLTETPVPGERELSLSRVNMTGIPRGVELEFITPDRLSLVVDRRVRQTLQVEPIFQGVPPEGFVFYGATSSPASLTVEGPAAEVQPLDRLRTNPIPLDRRTKPFSVSVATVPESPHVRVVDQRPLAVRVIVDAAPADMLFEVPVEVVGQILETAVSPTTLEAILTAPPSILEGLQPQMIKAIVDASDLAPRNRPYQAPVRFEFIDVSLDDQARISVRTRDGQGVSVRVFDRESGA